MQSIDHLLISGSTGRRPIALRYFRIARARTTGYALLALHCDSDA